MINYNRKDSKVKWNFKLSIWQLLNLLTAMVGYHIHHSIFWSVMDFLFMPFAIAKWLIMHQISISIIHDTFSFFLN